MDAREIKLDCVKNDDGWCVYDERSGLQVSQGHSDSDIAWMVAAERLAAIISDIRRSTANIDGDQR